MSNIDTIQIVPSAKPITVNIPTKLDLFRCYMPFIKGGALFFPKDDANNYSLGSKVFILLTLLNDPRNRKTFSGKIVWINKTGNNKGFGVNFGEGEVAKAIKEQIDNLLIDLPNKKDTANYTI